MTSHSPQYSQYPSIGYGCGGYGAATGGCSSKAPPAEKQYGYGYSGRQYGYGDHFYNGCCSPSVSSIVYSHSPYSARSMYGGGCYRPYMSTSGKGGSACCKHTGGYGGYY